jgi:hypothetical protein
MVIQPWWILAFAFVQMLVFVFLSEGVPSASTSSHGDTSIDNESDDIPPLIQRNVRSLDIGKVAVDRRIEKLQLELKKKLNATKVTVCQRYKQEGNKVIMEDTCQDSTDTIQLPTIGFGVERQHLPRALFYSQNCRAAKNHRASGALTLQSKVKPCLLFISSHTCHISFYHPFKIRNAT